MEDDAVETGNRLCGSPVAEPITAADARKIALRPEDTDGRFIPDFLEWLKAIGITSLKIVVLVNILLVLQRLMSELGVLRWLERPFYPLLRLMGLPASSSFLWLVANTLGLSYGEPS